MNRHLSERVSWVEVKSGNSEGEMTCYIEGTNSIIYK